MKKKVVLVALVVLIVGAGVFLYFPRGSVVEAVNAAVLAVLNADVEAQRGGEPGFEPALDGDVFATGDLLRADAEGRAVLTFFDGSTLSVEPNSNVRVVSLVKTADGGIQLTIEQTLGRTWASVADLATADSQFEIRTPSMVATVRGTAFETLVEKTPDGKSVTTVKTGEGEVVVQGEAGGVVTVPAGQQVEVEQGRPAPAGTEPQPPTPRLRFAAPAGVVYVVIDPRGLRCGVSAGKAERQVPRCDVVAESVVIGDVVEGTYSLVMSAGRALSDAPIDVEGLGVRATDFAHGFRATLAVGDLLRTTLPVTLTTDGTLGSSGFTPPEVITSVCGGEATGRVFSSGDVNERAGRLEGYARSSPGQPAALVVTEAELTRVANESVARAGAPVEVADLAVTIDSAGLHLAAKVTAGPLTVPARADLIAGARNGRLLFKLRGLDAGPLPQPAKEQIARAIERGLAEFGETFPLQVQRVAFRSDCMGIMGRTRG